MVMSISVALWSGQSGRVWACQVYKAITEVYQAARVTLLFFAHAGQQWDRTGQDGTYQKRRKSQS